MNVYRSYEPTRAKDCEIIVFLCTARPLPAKSLQLAQMSANHSSSAASMTTATLSVAPNSTKRSFISRRRVCADSELNSRLRSARPDDRRFEPRVTAAAAQQSSDRVLLCQLQIQFGGGRRERSCADWLTGARSQWSANQRTHLANRSASRPAELNLRMAPGHMGGRSLQ